MIERIIPSSGEALPAAGLGTWNRFDAGDRGYSQLGPVLEKMHRLGGKLIDSSPMYGRAEEAVGEATAGMSTRDDFFYATKVWTTGKKEGIAQMESSMRKMQRPVIDLMQIHNLVDWETHLQTLKGWKQDEKVKYIGITHYTDSKHEDLERIFIKEKIDFVQFNYSILQRHAEKRLLSAAADHGVAVIINRPFGEGDHFQKVSGKPLPAWAAEHGITTWSAFFLKYIIAHPSVTCVIPATGNPQHAAENFAAAGVPLPDEATREMMVKYIQSL